MRLTVTWTLQGQSQIFRPLWQAVNKNILLLFSPGCAQGDVHDTIKLSTLKTSNCLLVSSLIPVALSAPITTVLLYEVQSFS